MAVKAVQQGLTDVKLRGTLAPGRHYDGRGLGLYLVVRESGARSWQQRLRVRGGKVIELGHGTYPDVGLAEARRRAQAAQDMVDAGQNPAEARRAAKQQETIAVERTFSAAINAYVEAHAPAWKSAKTKPIFVNSLQAHAKPLLDRPARDITLNDVRATLAVIWTKTPVLAQKVRARIEAVLEWSTAAGWRSGPNPAAWAGALRPLLAKPSAIHKTRHFPALSWQRVPQFISALRQQPGSGARCLHLCILTACRSGEARGADWSEIDLDKAIWTIPPERMKAKTAHRIPLSPAAVALLKGLLPADGKKPARRLVFANADGKPYSDMTLLAVILRMHEALVERGEPGWLDEHGERITPHGFRTSFRTWCGDHAVPRELAEMSLAHKIGSAVEQAYARNDLLDRRREVVEKWCTFISSPALTVVEAAS